MLTVYTFETCIGFYAFENVCAQVHANNRTYGKQ